MKWIDFYYIQPLREPSSRRSATPRRWPRPSSRSACLSSRSSTRRRTNLYNSWIKPYINVPLSQLAPFTTGIFNEKLIPEPEAATQSRLRRPRLGRRGCADRQDANPASLLAAANTVGQSVNLRIVRLLA